MVVGLQIGSVVRSGQDEIGLGTITQFRACIDRYCIGFFTVTHHGVCIGSLVEGIWCAGMYVGSYVGSHIRSHVRTCDVGSCVGSGPAMHSRTCAAMYNVGLETVTFV